MLNKTELKRIDVFRGLKREQMDELMNWLEVEEHGVDRLIVKEGQKPDGMWLLLDGEVAVVKRTIKGRIRVNVLTAPTFFGEIGLLTNGNRSTSIRTLTPVRLGKLSNTLFQDRVKRRNLTAMLITINLGKLLTERLMSINGQLERLTERERALDKGTRFRESTA